MSTPQSTYTIHVLMAQRCCRYEDEYAPEALAVADQFTMCENPDYMRAKVRDAENSGDYSTLRVLAVQIPWKAVKDALNQTVKVTGEVKP